ncbi:MAG: hypothetical protein JST92_26860, partial [Deltaproteobacteria bacterium]|nr:hypothetical protein [Deltaproteobacteria bacterium]
TLNAVIVGGGVGTDGPQRALWTTSVLSTTHLAPFQTSTSDLGAAFAQVRLHWSATTGQLLVAASDGTAFELLSGPITAGAAPTVDLGVRAPLDLDRTAFSAAGCGDALVLAQGHASSTLSTTAEALFPALGTTTADQHVQVAAPFASEHGALVQVGSYLFAIGGRDANGLDTGAVQATKAKCPQLARSLHFAAPPATIEVSSTFSIALELRDGDGQFVAPHGTPVATVVQVEGNTDVQGVSDVIFTAGRAALSNLSFNTEASGVVLLARAPLLDAASSSPFGATLSFTQTPNAAVGFGCSSTGSQAWLALWPLAMVIFANLYRRRRLPLSRPEPAVKGRTLARTSRKTLGRLILVLAFAAGAARAALPTPPAAPPNKEQIAQARELNEQGTKALASGQYAAAITAFEGAYKLTGSQSMLYNLAETHRRLGHKEDAIELYRAYLLKAPKGPARADAEQMLAQMTGGAIQGTPPSTPAQPQPHAPAQAPAAPAKSSETSAPKSPESSPAKSSETSAPTSSESSPAKSSETSQKDAKKGKGGKPGKDGKADDKKAEAPAVAQPGPSQAVPAQPAAPTHATPAPTHATPAPTHATPAP